MSKDEALDRKDDPGSPLGSEISNAEEGMRSLENETSAEGGRPYKVGYGAPPMHTRFKPGHSGNPRGRPKKSKNLKTIVREVLNQPVVITKNGKKRTVSALEAAYQKVLGEALTKGDMRAALVLTQLAERAGMNEDEAPAAPTTLSRDEQEVMAVLAHRLGLPSPNEPRSNPDPEPSGSEEPDRRSTEAEQ